MSIAELEKQCVDMRKELAQLRMQLMLGQYQNSAKIRELRREIARTKTKIHLQKREN